MTGLNGSVSHLELSESFQQVIYAVCTQHAAEVGKLRRQLHSLRTEIEQAAGVADVFPMEGTSPGEHLNGGSDQNGSSAVSHEWINQMASKEQTEEDEMDEAMTNTMTNTRSENAKRSVRQSVQILMMDNNVEDMMSEDDEEIKAKDSPPPFSRRLSMQNGQVQFKRLERFLTSDQFEMGVIFLLFVNVLFMGIEQQYEGLKIGYAIDYPFFVLTAPEAWPGGKEVLFVIDKIFTVIFTVDVVLRIIVLRCAFWKQLMNYIDFIVVSASLVEVSMAMFSSSTELPFPPTFLRLLRLGKLVRALRIVKVSRVMETLQLIIKCIMASVGMLFWSVGILSIIQLIAGMIISHLVTSYLEDDTIPEEDRRAVFRYYGTFTRTVLTMFEVLFANWAPACRVLVDHVSESFTAVFLVYRCLVGFAVLNVVNAVFVQQTMKVAQNDEEIAFRQKQKAQEGYTQKLKKVFHELDKTGDGTVSWDDFKEILTAPKLKFWMSQLELESEDLVSLFHMMDNGTGELSLDAFLEGASRLKGPAKNVDLAKLLAWSQKTDYKLDKLLNNSVAGIRNGRNIQEQG